MAEDDDMVEIDDEEVKPPEPEKPAGKRPRAKVEEKKGIVHKLTGNKKLMEGALMKGKFLSWAGVIVGFTLILGGIGFYLFTEKLTQDNVDGYIKLQKEALTFIIELVGLMMAGKSIGKITGIWNKK